MSRGKLECQYSCNSLCLAVRTVADHKAKPRVSPGISEIPLSPVPLTGGDGRSSNVPKHCENGREARASSQWASLWPAQEGRGPRPRCSEGDSGSHTMASASSPVQPATQPQLAPSTCRVPRGLGIAARWCETVYAAGAEGPRSSGPLAQCGELGTGLGARCLCRARPGWSLKELQERRAVLCEEAPCTPPAGSSPAQCPDGSWASPFWGPHYRQVLCHLDLHWPLCRGLLAFVMFPLCS